MLYKKIFYLALLITSVLVFFTWSIIDNSNFLIMSDNVYLQMLFKILTSLILAYLFFYSIASFVIYLLNRLKKIKKFIFRSIYFEGTWIGFYRTKDNNPIVYFQIIEQDIEHMHIYGEAYYLNMNLRCSWHSTSEVTIEIKNATLSYLTDIELDINKVHIPGFFISTFFKKGIREIPWRIKGTSTSLNNTNVSIEQIKVSDKTDILKCIDDKTKLLQEAIKTFQDDINNINTPPFETPVLLELV
ncbi:MAG: hypothetical protein FWB95_05575 [Treponema sp.]|nr:hypothetical protein [Treponema sp.]